MGYLSPDDHREQLQILESAMGHVGLGIRRPFHHSGVLDIVPCRVPGRRARAVRCREGDEQGLCVAGDSAGGVQLGACGGYRARDDGMHRRGPLRARVRLVHLLPHRVADDGQDGLQRRRRGYMDGRRDDVYPSGGCDHRGDVRDPADPSGALRRRRTARHVEAERRDRLPLSVRLRRRRVFVLVAGDGIYR